VIFLNRFYWPDETATAQLLADLAEGLAARGHAVTVIASLPSSKPDGRETRRGVRIVRVGSTRSASPGVAAKALDFFTFYLFALLALGREVRRDDAVVALTDPPLIGVGAAAIAGLRGARLFHWVQDIYPEVAVTLSGCRALNLLRGWRDGAWRRARGCVTLGTDMAEVLAEAGVPPAALHLVPNWAPAGVRPPPPAEVRRVRAAWGLADRFIIGYSGNLGRVHDLDAIVELAENLRGDPGIWFVLVGGGPQRVRIEDEAKRRGLTQMRFLPPAPRADLAASLGAPDLQLVTLRGGCERCVFPSKLYGVAAIGRPILFLGPAQSEIARLVNAYGMGGAFGRNDLASAGAAIRAYRASPERLRAAAAGALRFAAATPGAGAAVAAWERWLFPGADIDLAAPLPETGSPAHS
jgi:glycosyltransferase involved in cell wall biosynthesis